MKKLLFILFFIISQIGISQNRAPSCWLKYQDHYQGDIIINTVKVVSPSPTYTYYCTLQWNAGQEGGGYCGIQEHPDGRNFIFSIWNSASSPDAITAPYTHPGTQTEAFGGEGTGLKSWNFAIGWEDNQWYSFVSRTWDDNSHTMFGYWVYNHTDLEWYHLVTMKYPVANIRFNSSTGTFIEDWLGNGSNKREVHHKEGWKRKTSDLSWNPFTTSYFERVSPDVGAINFINNYDGGATANHYFMKSGGTTTPTTNSSGTTVTLSNSNTYHGLATGEILNLSSTVSLDNLLLNWNSDTSKSPQFSYHAKIYDNSAFSGTPLLEVNKIIPHVREENLNTSTLTNGNTYYLQFYVKDIFDNQSATTTSSFVANATLGIEEANILDSVSYYPNPFKNKINLKFKSLLESFSVKLTDIYGKTIFSNNYSSSSQIELKFPNNIESGTYFLNITNNKGNSQVIKVVKN